MFQVEPHIKKRLSFAKYPKVQIHRTRYWQIDSDAE